MVAEAVQKTRSPLSVMAGDLVFLVRDYLERPSREDELTIGVAVHLRIIKEPTLEGDHDRHAHAVRVVIFLLHSGDVGGAGEILHVITANQYP